MSNFPAVDPPPHQPARATVRELITPGDDVPARRIQQRASIGIDGQPMIEIDRTGSVVYVGGDWEALVGFTKPGPGALDALISGVTLAGEDQVHESIDAARSQRIPSAWEHDSLPALPFLKIVPIPSATEGGVMHALVGLSANVLRDRSVEPLSIARHRVESPGRDGAS